MGKKIVNGVRIRTYESISRYEFASNEFVNSLACVSLETVSTESGHKDFIAVGTTINRGEDLAVKGAVRFCYSNILILCSSP
jgi:hypothetical protein